jgi:flagellar M-ring protein FliF
MAPCFGFEKTDLMRLAELVVLSVVARLVLLLVVRPLLGRLLAMPSTAVQRGAGRLGRGSGLAAGRRRGAGDSRAGATRLPGLRHRRRSEADAIAAEIDQMIDLNQVEGRVRASSIRKISDLVDQHPEQAVNLIRQWVYQEQ